MGSTGHLLSMSQDENPVTDAPAGMLEVALKKWLVLEAGNLSGESKWLWALESSEALSRNEWFVCQLAMGQLILVKVLSEVVMARMGRLASCNLLLASPTDSLCSNLVSRQNLYLFPLFSGQRWAEGPRAFFRLELGVTLFAETDA